MPQGVVQRRGVPQADAVAERFGQDQLGGPVALPDFILPVAKVPRVDLPSIGGAVVAALAANRSIVQLFNPAGSNTHLLLKRIWASATSATTMRIKTHDTALADSHTTIAAMIRQEGTSQVAPLAQIRSVQGADVGSIVAFLNLEINVTEEFNFIVSDGEHFDGFVIEPGRGILVVPSGDNVGMKATWHWLERQVA